MITGKTFAQEILYKQAIFGMIVVCVRWIYPPKERLSNVEVDLSAQRETLFNVEVDLSPAERHSINKVYLKSDKEVLTYNEHFTIYMQFFYNKHVTT